MSRRLEPARPTATRRRIAGAGGALLIAAMVLAACSVPSPGSAPSTDTSTQTSLPSGTTETPSTTPSAAPVLVPGGSASDNLPYFASIVASVWAGPDQASGRAYIDALVAAGFDKSAMQVTNDESTVGNRAESIQFSVLWAGECLVGQVGPATGDPVSVVLPVVGDGACLIGQTRPIDW
ncbi:hypothetical protein AAIB33_06595 [Microbacterium sp. AZCO]|uniref:DUF6993 domain-containing protein n=1 Tax=Microbacterium sp. AZCO TaxID=3142976 RepID=UPI0031F33B6A